MTTLESGSREMRGEVARPRRAALSRRWAVLAAMRPYLPLILLLGTIIFVYRGWLASGAIEWSDWRFQPAARLLNYWPFPTLWNGNAGTGYINIFDGPMLPILSFEAFLIRLGIDPTVSMRVIWIFAGLCVGVGSTYLLAIEFFSSRLAGVIAGLFFGTNTYAALVLSGGQFTVADGYLLMAPILLCFYRALRRPTVSRYIVTGVVVAIQVMYDLRSTYITLGMLLFLGVFHVLGQREAMQALRAVGVVVLQMIAIGVLCAVIHSYWLLPLHYATGGGGVALPTDNNGIFWVHVLSYMQLDHALTLFHPFSFQHVVSPQPAPVDPLSLLLPLPVFAVFLRRRANSIDLFLFSTAIVAIFLVKGSNPPAGTIYEWMFNHFTGFNMFRDPSKFFQPLGLVYGLLLGEAASTPSVREACAKMGRGRLSTAALSGLVPGACLVFVLLQAFPTASNTGWGTLNPQVVPADFTAVNRYIDGQRGFFRTIWFPTQSFGTFSLLHPSMALGDVAGYLNSPLPNPSDPTSWVHLPRARATLRMLSVKYIIVAPDPANTPIGYRTNTLGSAQLIRKVFPSFPLHRFGRIYVFENRSYVPQIYVPHVPVSPASLHLLRGQMKVQVVNPADIEHYISVCSGCLDSSSHTPNFTRQEVIVRRATHPFLLIFNQAFDTHWIASIEPVSTSRWFGATWMRRGIAPRDHVRVNGYANAWWITRPGTYRVVIEYWPQRLLEGGWIVSWIVMLSCLIVALVRMARRHGWRVPRRVFVLGRLWAKARIMEDGTA